MSKISDFTDNEIIEAVRSRSHSGYSGRTFWILQFLTPQDYRNRANMAALRRRLRKLEAEGKVIRHPRYSYPNDIYWTVPQ